MNNLITTNLITTNLIDFKINLRPAIRLNELGLNNNTPNLLFYGVRSVGKKTLIRAFLKHLFNVDINSFQYCNETLQIKNGKSNVDIKVSFIKSSHHVELLVQDIEKQDRLVVQYLIENLATSPNIVAEFSKMENDERLKMENDEKLKMNKNLIINNNTENTENNENNKNIIIDDENLKNKSIPTFKIFIIYNVDQLSHRAQHALRRIMEVHSHQCRFILTTRHFSRIINPLKSRCYLMRIELNRQEVLGYIKNLLKNYQLNLTDKQIQLLCEDNKYCIQDILFDLEILGLQKTITILPNNVTDQLPKSLKVVQRSEKTIEQQLVTLVEQLLINHTKINKNSLIINLRTILKSILGFNVRGDEILKLLTTIIYKRFTILSSKNPFCLHEIAQLAANSSRHMNIANNKQELIHLENFVIQCILLLKK